jgi:hypothetical protein
MRFFSALITVGLLAGGCGNDRGGTGTPDSGGGDTALPDSSTDDVLPGDTDAEGCVYPDVTYGTLVGRGFEPFTLDQCDGTPFDFVQDGFCDSSMTVISIAAGWCPPCIVESRQLSARITEHYREQRVRVVQVLVQDEDYRAPDLAYCEAWVSRFSLTNIEVIDPAQVTQIYFPDNALPSTIIVDDEGIIQFRENGATDGLTSLRAAIERLLADGASDDTE